MDRRTFISSVTLGLLAAPLAVEAQQAGTVPRLCFLAFSPGIPLSTFDPFFQGLRDRGYVDGQTITIDYLSADGHAERFPALAADCLRLKVDIIVATTTDAAQAAKRQPAPSRSSCTPSATLWRAASS
jgi:putative ABC transport system substrate-binding protein